MIKEVFIDNGDGSEFHVGTKFTATMVVSRKELQDFVAISGDTNPMHHDAKFAVERGFRGPLVYGGLIVASISHILGNHIPGAGCVWRDLEVRFRGPYYRDEEAQILGAVTYYSKELRILHLEFRINVDYRLVAEGQAHAGW